MSESPEADVWEPGRALISRASAWTLGGVLLALFLVGTIWDMQISELLFDPTVLTDPEHANFVGVFGAAYGEIPAGMALVAAGTLLIAHRNRARLWLTATQVVGGVLLLLLGAAMLMYLPTMYLSWPPVLILAIGALIAASVCYGVLRLASATDSKLALRVAMVMFLVVLVETLLVQVLKFGWERPRMRLIEELASGGETLSFHAWWQPGTPEKAELIANSVTEYGEFTSFPSGHTANGALAILLTALPVLRPSLWTRRTWLFWGGAVWGLYVALSRIVMGAHFLTDTMAGFTLGFATILVAYRVAFPAQKAAA